MIDVAKIRKAFEDYVGPRYIVHSLYKDNKDCKIWALMCTSNGKGIDVCFEFDVNTGEISTRDHFNLLEAITEKGKIDLDEALENKCIYESKED